MFDRWSHRVPDGGLVGALGIVAWLVLVALQGRQLGVIASLLATGPMIVVPLGLASLRPLAVGMCVAAPAAVAALILHGATDDVSRPAVAMASLWLIATSAVAIPAGIRWLKLSNAKRFSLDAFLPVAALVELAVAAAWMVAVTLRIELLGFSQAIVMLTSVHFHMAGFGACTVAVVRMRAAQSPFEEKWSGRAALLVLGASPTVAIGHLAAGALELTGGILLTAGVWIVAYLGWRESKLHKGPKRVLLIVGALAPVVPMLLALHYGLTRVSDIEQISFRTIGLIHGGLNAFGFLAANLMAALVHPSDLDLKSHENR